jgi:hypothetical protein
MVDASFPLMRAQVAGHRQPRVLPSAHPPCMGTTATATNTSIKVHVFHPTIAKLHPCRRHQKPKPPSKDDSANKTRETADKRATGCFVYVRTSRGSRGVHYSTAKERCDDHNDRAREAGIQQASITPRRGECAAGLVCVTFSEGDYTGPG